VNALESSTAFEVPDYDVSFRAQAVDGVGRSRTPTASTSNSPETFQSLAFASGCYFYHTNTKPGNHKFRVSAKSPQFLE